MCRPPTRAAEGLVVTPPTSAWVLPGGTETTPVIANYQTRWLLAVAFAVQLLCWPWPRGMHNLQGHLCHQVIVCFSANACQQWRDAVRHIAGVLPGEGEALRCHSRAACADPDQRAPCVTGAHYFFVMPGEQEQAAEDILLGSELGGTGFARGKTAGVASTPRLGATTEPKSLSQKAVAQLGLQHVY